MNEHRRFLAHAPGFRPIGDAAFFARIGAQPAVDRFVDALYARIEEDGELRPLFGHDLANERRNQKRFFGEWLGGAPRYSDSAWGGLYHRHDDVPITRALAGRWLGHVRHALDAIEDTRARSAIFERMQALAMRLVNHEGKDAPARHRSERVASCGIPARTAARAFDHAKRGEEALLGALTIEVPELLARDTFAAQLLQTAVLAGRAGSPHGCSIAAST